MEIFGFDDNKNLVAVEMSPEEVLNSSIDPYRVDLFEPRPVRRTATLTNGDGEALLNFTRTRPFSFAFPNCEKTRNDVLIGMHDGERGACFRGQFVNQMPVISGQGAIGAVYKLSPLVAADVEPCAVDFARAFASYESLIAEGWSGYAVGPPSSNAAITLEGGKLFYRHDPRPWAAPAFERHSFTGTMFESVRIPVELPEKLTWLFRAFSRWNPMVCGSTLRQAMLDQPFDTVHVLLAVHHKSQFSEISQFLGSQFSRVAEEQAEFDHASSMPIISVTGGGVSYKFAWQPPRHSGRFWRTTDFSVNQFAATGPDSVFGSRIALHDLAERTIRLITRPETGRAETDGQILALRRRAESLSESGFQLLPVQIASLEAKARDGKEESRWKSLDLTTTRISLP